MRSCNCRTAWRSGSSTRSPSRCRRANRDASIATRQAMPKRTSYISARTGFSSTSRRGPAASTHTGRSFECHPRFAPAWARLGRCYRLLGKFGNPADGEANLERGKQAILRALEINGDLSLAHQLYAYVEVEAGNTRA